MKFFKSNFMKKFLLYVVLFIFPSVCVASDNDVDDLVVDIYSFATYETDCIANGRKKREQKINPTHHSDFQKLDMDGDTEYTNKDALSLQKNLEKINGLISTSNEYAEAISEESFTENLVGSMTNLMVDDSFYQGDVNKDGCLDKEEYAKMLSQQLRDVTATNQELGREEFKRTDTNSDGCMAEEEHLNHYRKLREKMRVDMIPEYVREKFGDKGIRQMYQYLAKGTGECFDENEYIEKTQKMAEETKLSMDMELFYQRFDSIKKNKEGCLSKEEFAREQNIFIRLR